MGVPMCKKGREGRWVWVPMCKGGGGDAHIHHSYPPQVLPTRVIHCTNTQKRHAHIHTCTTLTMEVLRDRVMRTFTHAHSTAHSHMHTSAHSLHSYIHASTAQLLSNRFMHPHIHCTYPLHRVGRCMHSFTIQMSNRVTHAHTHCAGITRPSHPRIHYTCPLHKYPKVACTHSLYIHYSCIQ